MSVFEVTDAIAKKKIETAPTDFICPNFANADTVGHTGVWEAVIKGRKTVDTCVQRGSNSSIENRTTAIFFNCRPWQC